MVNLATMTAGDLILKASKSLAAVCIALWLCTGAIFGCALVPDDFKLSGNNSGLDVVVHILPDPRLGVVAAFVLALMCSQGDFMSWGRARLGLTYFFCMDFSIRLLPLLASGLGAEAHPLHGSSIPAQIAPRGVHQPTKHEFLVNTIGFGVVAITSFLIRIYNKVFVMKEWAWEEYIMCCVIIPVYLVEMALINVSANYQTNLYTPQEAAAIFSDPNEVAKRIYGSKLTIGLEQSMLIVTWGVKLCLLVFYLRVTNQVADHRKALRYLFWYIVFGYVAIQICYFFILCQPFEQYYAMPVENIQCATYQIYSSIQMFFNITSDLILYVIPLHMIARSRVSTGRVSIYICFGLGFITILFAILNKVYNFGSPLTTTYAIWYIRETSMGILVCNLIASWKLIQKCTRLAEVHIFLNGAEIRNEKHIVGSLNPLPVPVQQFFRKRIHEPLSLLYTTVLGRDPNTHTTTADNECQETKSGLHASNSYKDSPLSREATPVVTQQGPRSSGSDAANPTGTMDDISVSRSSSKKGALDTNSVDAEEDERGRKVESRPEISNQESTQAWASKVEDAAPSPRGLVAATDRHSGL